MKELITIRSFNTLNDLYMAKSFLESQGIECYTKDEFVSQVYATTNIVNGVKLEVPYEQAEQAIKLLIEGGFATEEDYKIPEGMKTTEKVIDWLKNLFK